jgi:hypothetical protein
LRGDDALFVNAEVFLLHLTVKFLHLFGFIFVAVNTGLAPLRDDVLPFGSGVLSLLVDVDDLELIQLVIPEGLPVVQLQSAHLAHLLSEVPADAVATEETHFLLPRIGPQIPGFDGETVTVVHDQSVGKELVRRQHLQTEEGLGVGQGYLLNGVYLVDREGVLPRMQSADLMPLRQLLHRQPNLLKALSKDEQSQTIRGLEHNWQAVLLNLFEFEGEGEAAEAGNQSF